MAEESKTNEEKARGKGNIYSSDPAEVEKKIKENRLKGLNDDGTFPTEEERKANKERDDRLRSEGEARQKAEDAHKAPEQIQHEKNLAHDRVESNQAKEEGRDPNFFSSPEELESEGIDNPFNEKGGHSKGDFDEFYAKIKGEFTDMVNSLKDEIYSTINSQVTPSSLEQSGPPNGVSGDVSSGESGEYSTDDYVKTVDDLFENASEAGGKMFEVGKDVGSSLLDGLESWGNRKFNPLSSLYTEDQTDHDVARNIFKNKEKSDADKDGDRGSSSGF